MCPRKNRVRKRTKHQTAHPVVDAPAYLIESPVGLDGTGNALIIADLHLGIEYSLAQAGAHLPSLTEKLIERVLGLCSKFDVSQLIILGDIKHTIPTTSYQELRELPEVFKNLAIDIESLEIIPGNHDGNLRKLVPQDLKKIKLHPMSGIVLHNIGLFHGHTWPNVQVLQASQIIMAHNHPNVLFVDNLGGRISYSCWVRGKLNISKAISRYPELEDNNQEIIIIPAFNDIGSGTPVNAEKSEFLGPILRNKYMDINNSNIFLLDGTALGKLQALIELSETKRWQNLKILRL
jgi:putative SbcD/Mre11-related phosphoesterase